MADQGTTERYETVVIGAGQAGLSAGYHLKRRGVDALILEANERIGDQWRSRYDSLRLYSPARYDGLPGMPFPLPGRSYPTDHQLADYLEAYAAHFDLPVRMGVEVDGLRAADDGSGYLITAGELRIEARQVIIAAGYFRQPHVPDVAAELDPAIRQFHSSEYRRPSQLADGPVLVVGLSHSGADMAMETVANGHPTIVSGKGHGQLPFSVDSRVGRLGWPLMKFVAWNVLTIRTPVGRKMRPEIRKNGGAPLLRHRKPELAKAGVEMTEARTTGVRDGKPLLADGRVLDVANVIWCTGFRPDFSWVHLPIFAEDGFPMEERGVVPSSPGIYFVGLVFQFGFTSMLVVGAGRDAGYVVERVAARAAERGTLTEPAAAAVRS